MLVHVQRHVRPRVAQQVHTAHVLLGQSFLELEVAFSLSLSVSVNTILAVAVHGVGEHLAGHQLPEVGLLGKKR